MHCLAFAALSMLKLKHSVCCNCSTLHIRALPCGELQEDPYVDVLLECNCTTVPLTRMLQYYVLY